VIAPMLAVDWMAAVGRLHPLILHLPIGLLVALAGVELVRRMRGRTEPDASRSVLVLLLFVSTFFAALTGWLLHESDDYGDPVELHEWLGIALLAVTSIVAIAHRRGSARFGMWLALALVLVVPTAHFGASLTHGSGFLLEPWRATESVSDATAADDPFVAAQPFFAAYCTRCHGESKQKGGLALHDFAALMAGGDDGPVVIPGDPAASPLLARLHLPLDDDDHMPPEGKRQPTDDEQAALADWITSLDGPLDASIAQRLSGTQPEPIAASAAADADGSTSQPTRDDTDRLAAAHELRVRLVHVAPLAADSPLLLVDYGAAQLVPGELEAQLEPLRDWIADLDLSTHELNSTDLEFVARLPRLERLDLRELSGGPLDLAPLSSSSTLVDLNLSGTALIDGSVEALATLPALRKVFLWRTGIDETDLERLASARPQLEVHAASAAPDEPLEVEPEVVFEAFVPEPTGSLEPTNESCPVTGKPVDARYSIVSDGRVIGFCCPNCPATYWADPVDEAPDATDR
jgi:uncharacterized membrane protein